MLTMWRVAMAFGICMLSTTAKHASAEISYVMEPFDSVADLFTRVYGDQGATNLTRSIDAAFGKSSIQVDYQSVQTDTWGGYVDFGRVASRAHNCQGATHLSLWYKILTPQSSPMRCHLRLILMDDSDCVPSTTNCSNLDNLEHYYTFQYILDDSRSSWRELRIELRGDDNSDTPFWQTGWTGITGNRVLDVSRIRGWRLEMNVDSQGDIGSSSGGSLVVDQLACVGGGELFGAAFQMQNSSFSEALESGQWYESYNGTRPSQVEHHAEIVDGSLMLNFTTNQTTALNQNLTFMHIAPYPAYYNLSQATSLSLDYDSMQALNGNAMIQLDLLDVGQCKVNCEAYPGSMLDSYAFLSIEFNATKASGNGAATLQPGILSSGTNLSATSLDATSVKGFRLTVSLEKSGSKETVMNGQVRLSNLFALTRLGTANDVGPSSASTCATEPDLYFDVNQDGVRVLEFSTSKCCQACDSDQDCLYALSDGVKCFLAPPYLNSSSIGDTGLIHSELIIKTFWMDDKFKRGDFCTICECNAMDRTIDCRGRNLRIMPKTFTPTDASWSPEVLDLRGNHIFHIGASALSSIAPTLRELRLPSSIRHFSHECFEQLPVLDTVTMEGNAVTSHPETSNVVTDSTGFFTNICCKPGMHIDLQSPSNGLTFCNLTKTSPGIDAIYAPFVELIGGTRLAELKTSSSFMSEASESVEKCAQYCAINDDCRYFSYDARPSNTENSCHHLATEGTAVHKCCDDEDYADENRTKPGWISGRVPRTRHEVDNASVVVAVSRFIASKENNFTALVEFSLGSSPLRGAVWIKPVLAAETTFDVTFMPHRIALYDNATVATVLVTLTIPVGKIPSSTVSVTTEVEACDSAFVSFDTPADRIMTIDVVLESSSSTKTVLYIVLPFVLALLLLVAYMYVDHKKRKADSVWIIQPSELIFREPPEVLGRGTFGLVVLAEYRGTQVAVKRVLPPRDGSTGSHDSLCDMPSTSFPGSTSTSFRRGKNNPWIDAAMSGSFLFSSGNRAYHQHYQKLKSEFIEEMRLLSKLRHPCITTVMGAVLGRNDEPMLVMEYMDHGSLYDLLHNETMIIEGEYILPILRDIAQGVRFLHAATPMCVHGDLKSANILVDSKFRSKVADFGLSQKKRLGVTGTPFWMAPELLNRTSNNSAATDVYSFGIILYELYARKDPYEGEEPSEVLRLVADPVINKRPPVPASCPSEIQSMMAECLAHQPERRPTFKDLDIRLKSYDVSTVELGETRFSAQFKKEKRTSTLLFDVFPEHVASALRDGRKVEPETRDMVTIFFSDIVGFTNVSAELTPMKISDLLDRLYNKFDALSHEYDVFKVETIGDAYMAVTNLTKDQLDHTKRIAEFAIAAVAAANETLIDLDDPDKGFVSIRVGFHSGAVVANVVGSRNPRYCLFGDTVNTAARMESNSVADRIHCSEAAAKLLRFQHPAMPIRSRGRIIVKGKGDMVTYWVNETPLAPESYVSHTGNRSPSLRSVMSAGSKNPQTRFGRPVPRRQHTMRFARSLRPPLGTTDDDQKSQQSKRSLVRSEGSFRSVDWADNRSIGK